MAPLEQELPMMMQSAPRHRVQLLAMMDKMATLDTKPPTWHRVRLLAMMDRRLGAGRHCGNVT